MAKKDAAWLVAIDLQNVFADPESPWASADFASGSAEGTAAKESGLSIDAPTGTEEHPKPDGSTATYDLARWTSPSYAPVSWSG